MKESYCAGTSWPTWQDGKHSRAFSSLGVVNVSAMLGYASEKSNTYEMESWRLLQPTKVASHKIFYANKQWQTQDIHLRGAHPNREFGFGNKPMVCMYVNFRSKARIFIIVLEANRGLMKKLKSFL